MKKIETFAWAKKSKPIYIHISRYYKEATIREIYDESYKNKPDFIKVKITVEKIK